MRDRAAEAAKKSVAERDWTDQRAIDRIEELKISSSAARSCSYCDGTGHNMRGCVTRKSDILNIVSRTIDFRKKFIQALKANNFGVGAIVSYNGYLAGYGYARDNGGAHYLLVKSFCEEQIVPWNCYNKRSKLNDCVRAQNLKSLNGDQWGSIAAVNVPSDVVNSIDPNDYENDYSWATTVSGSCSTGIDEVQFVSLQACEAVVRNIFDAKGRNKKVATRGNLVAAGIINFIKDHV
jgi:hypothetical protein